MLFFLLDLILSKWIFDTEFHPNTSALNSRSESISTYCNYVNSKKEKMANAGLENIIVTITFSKPLDQAEAVKISLDFNIIKVYIEYS